jgi:hypothetical protein
MRHIYRYDRKLGKVVEISEDQIRKRLKNEQGGPFQIMPDIEPYQAVGIDANLTVTSRSHHRELLKDHGMIEVGNEKPQWMRDKEEAANG